MRGYVVHLTYLGPEHFPPCERAAKSDLLLLRLVLGVPAPVRDTWCWGPPDPLMGTLFEGAPLGRRCSWTPDVWKAERGDVALRDAPHVFELRRFAAEHWRVEVEGRVPREAGGRGHGALLGLTVLRPRHAPTPSCQTPGPLDGHPLWRSATRPPLQLDH